MRATALFFVILASCAHAAPSETKDWYRDSIGYEIFVRSFQDSDGDGIGDLNGIRSRLPDLEALGVDLLWLTPFQPGPTYHGYAVANYRAVGPEYGTMQDFEALIAEAHARKMHVILDLVLNHSADTHPWFKERKSWYVWRDQDPAWHQVWSDWPTWFAKNGEYYYGLFGPGMPDLNYENPDVEREMLDTASFWLARGADGFRLDAIRYLVETGPGPKGQADTEGTHAFLRKLRARVDHDKPGAILIGEVWEKDEIIAPYFGSKSQPELEMAFDFTTAQAIVDSISREDGKEIAQALEQRLSLFPSDATAATFVTNHDQVRIASRIHDDEGRALAAALLLTLPGTPWLYYGEEIAMTNGPKLDLDLDKRRPMQWSADAKHAFTSSEAPWIAPTSTRASDMVDVQAKDPHSLYARYRTLTHLRQTSKILRRGDARVVQATGSTSQPLVVSRRFGGKEVTLVYNFATGDNEVHIGERVVRLPGRSYRLLE